MSLVVRIIDAEQLHAFRATLMSVFGMDLDQDPTGDARLAALLAPAQAWAAFDGATMVATAATFALSLNICGATLPMAGLTHVTVRPTHRRRGLLRQLIAAHLADAQARGVALSGLWASEASIYGRFGYGTAAHHTELHITQAHLLRVTVPDGPADHMRPVETAEAQTLLPALYAQATAQRPGALARTPTWWQQRRFLEAPFVRKGASTLRHVVAYRGTAAVGYVVYRQRPAWQQGLPAGAIEIGELHGCDARAEASLWQFVLAIDLFPTVVWANAPADCALPHWVDNPRRITRQASDNIWLRLGDVASCLQARRYPQDGDLRFTLDDDAAWHLMVRDGQALCTPLAPNSPTEVRMDRATLSSLYLGAAAAPHLHYAGRITGSQHAVSTLDQLMRWAPAPWCPEIF